MVESGYEATKELLKKQPQITALFAVNDKVALAAMNAAMDAGKRVPDDISIFGYDDVDLAGNAKPPLTTMHVDTVAMGRAAVQLIMNRLEHPDSARVTLTIHPTLVERESVAKAKVNKALRP